MWDYTQDLLYTDVQGPLFGYVLPFCLQAWREDLLGSREGYAGFVEQFYIALANRRLLDAYLSPSQYRTVSDFMRQTILDEIDAQRGLIYEGSMARPYHWFRALATFGVIVPHIDLLWDSWWRINTVGRATAFIQYLTCLMYRENENPVFKPWTPHRGGGPPSLWEFEGLYQHRWIDANVGFLRTVLTPPNLKRALDLAVERLAGQPEHTHAGQILEDFPLCETTIGARCNELPRILETEGDGIRSWSA